MSNTYQCDVCGMHDIKPYNYRVERKGIVDGWEEKALMRPVIYWEMIPAPGEAFDQYKGEAYAFEHVCEDCADAINLSIRSVVNLRRFVVENKSVRK